MKKDRDTYLAPEPLLTKWQVADSLDAYAVTINSKHGLSHLQLYAYPDIDMRNHPCRSGRIEADGTYGLAFAYDLSSRGVAFVGFDFGNSQRLRKNFPQVPWSQVKDDPIIVQLQTSGDPDTTVYFNSMRWEIQLTKLVLQWLKQNRFTRVHLVPAEMNPYNEVRLSNWGKLRYNGTAKKCGFKKTSSGLYVSIFN